jgi:8-oxo-dGTP pyrophosphatase MutT (NUDIX family)
MGDRWIAPAPMLAQVVRRLTRVLAPPAVSYVPLRVAGSTVGWLTLPRVQRLERWPRYFTLGAYSVDCVPSLATPTARTEAFAEVARALASEGALTAWRDERYTVAAEPGEPALFELERAAARYFGIHTFAVHASGLVGTEDGWRMWLARRSPAKPIDPGLLDNLVGGGIPSGAGVEATLVKEAWEEAGIARDAARQARPAGEVRVCRDQPDGMQRETIYVHDLWLPTSFAPVNQDGEATEHWLCSPQEALAAIATDDVTADASLVVVDFLLRHGHVAPSDASFAALHALRSASTSDRGQA